MGEWGSGGVGEWGSGGQGFLKRGKGERGKGKNYYQCPMPNAQCPMPNAQCPMPNAQCPITHSHQLTNNN
ncbi:hypothetical protein [Tolypothrix sp. VBCCA 56010]|uniref:hypothetical protein n=1 Tax=Tolypothrix sp. VBCCA 56010 TaxID=3137731 RepID=UPI003D7E4879